MRMTFIIIIIIISHNNLRLKSEKKVAYVSQYLLYTKYWVTSGDFAMDIIHTAPGFLQILIRVTAERTPNGLRRERKYNNSIEEDILCRNMLITICKL